MFFFFFPDSLEKDPADIRKGRRPQISAHLPFWANLAQQIHEIQPDLPHIQNESQLNFSNTLDSFTNTTPQSAKSTENSIQVRAIEAETDLQPSPILSPNFDSTFQQLHDSSAPLRADGEGIHDEDTVNRELLLRIVDPALIPQLNQFPDSVIPRNSSAVFDLGNWTLVFFYEDIDNLVLNCRGEVIPTSESPYAICDFGLTHRLLRVPTFPHALINVKHSNSASNAIESNIGSQTLPRSENSIIAVPSPNVTVESPTVNVEAPIVNVAPPSLNIEGTVVNVAPPTVEVAAPIINVSPSSAIVPVTVNPPAICVAPPSVSVAPQSISVAAPNVTLSPQTITVGAPSITLPSINFSSPSVSVAAPTISLPPINVTVNVPSAQETSKPETRGSISRLIRALEAIQDSSDGGDEAGEGGGEVKRAKVAQNSRSQRRQLKISERQSFTIIRSEDRRALEDLDERDGNETIYVSDGGPDEEPKPRKPFRVPNFSSPSSSESEMVSNPKRELSVANVSSESPAKNEEVRSEADKSQRRETAKEESSDDYGSAKSRSDRSQSSILITQLREALVKTASAPASALKEAVEAINLPKSKAIFETKNSHAAPCNDITEWIAENEWFPEPTQLQCSRCLFTAKNSNDLNAHRHRLHPSASIINPLDSFYSMLGFNNEWAMDSEDSNRMKNGELKYDAKAQRFTVFVCPVPECRKAFNAYSNLREHIRGHKEKAAEIKELGGFWSSIRWMVQRNIREKKNEPALVRFGEVLQSTTAYLCPLCPYHCAVKKEVFLHAASAHTESEAASMKGTSIPMCQIIPLLEIKEKNKDTSSKCREQKNFTSEIRTGLKNENRQANRAKLRNNECTTPQSRSKAKANGKSGTDAVVNWVPQENEALEEAKAERINSSPNREERERQTEKWYRKYSDEAEESLPIPNRSERLKMTKKMRDLFNRKIIPLLEKNVPADESEEEWEHFESCILKITHQIHKVLRWAMKKRLTKRARRGKVTPKMESEKREELFNVGVRRKDWQTLSGKIKRLSELYSSKENQGRANAISRLEDESTEILKRIPEGDVLVTLGGGDIEHLRSFIREVSEEERGKKLQWAMKVLSEAEDRIEGKALKRRNAIRQQQYRDDARRTFRRIVAERSPECNLSVEDAEVFFAGRWEKSPEFMEATEGSEWRLPRTIKAEDAERLEEDLLNVTKITDTIISRGLLSANGPDGIPNAAFRMAPILAAKATKIIIEAMLKTRKCPSIWKGSRTILLYKKGDPKDPANWRPISINDCWYRIIACHIAKCLFSLNAHVPFVTRNQKGFIPNVSGCSEHLSCANELLMTAAREHRQVFFAAIDFADAFGSVPHNLISSTLRQIGVPESVVGTIEDAYKEAYTKIGINGRSSDDIKLKRGVKQGCPLSPLLFDMCLDPLIRRIEKENQADGFHYVVGNETKSKSIQAYADDVLLIACSEEGLKRELDTLHDFCQFSKMTLAPKKCHIFGYAARQGRIEGADGMFKIDGSEIKVEGLDDALEYLGAPIAARRKVKLARGCEELSRIEAPLEKLKSSGLTISQTVDAIKRFVTPSIDYALMNGQISKKNLDRVDVAIRKVVCEKIGGPSLPTEIFYSGWKDGGFGLQKLTERADCLTITLFANLSCSMDTETRNWMKEFTNNEAKARGIDKCDEDSEVRHFLNWKEANGKLLCRRPRGRNTLAVRAAKACMQLNIGLVLPEDGSHAKIYDLEGAGASMENKVKASRGEVARVLGQIMRKRHQRRLAEDYPLKGHSFESLKRRPESNFFFGNCSAPTSDALVRFAVRGRTNTLPTAENKNKADPRESNQCPMCHQKESLMHKLNGCRSQMIYYTERHNLIVEAVASAILTHIKPAPALHRSSGISTGNMHLSEDLRKLKPDIWFIRPETETLNIIEVNVPYGSLTDTESGRMSTLEVRRKEKIEKYEGLRKECEQQLGYPAKLFVVIVSSLGAIPSATINTMKELLKCSRRDVKLWAKRLCVKAILGSFRTFHHLRHSIPTHTALTQSTNEPPNQNKEILDSEGWSESADLENITQEEEQLEERRVSQLQATH